MKKFYKQIFLFFLISGSIFYAYFFVFSYGDKITHPALTEQAVKLHNDNAIEKISSKEMEWIKKGSAEEDINPRYINHFYDPIYKTALKDGLVGDIAKTSIAWAHSSVSQSTPAIGRGDYTWESAIYYYQNGDKEKAYIALGHILHLLEDMAVPAHTRDDGHGIAEEPYETWVDNYIKDNKINFLNVSSVNCEGLDQCFSNLAYYTNTNFFSKDTINSDKYKNPKIDGSIFVNDSNNRKIEYGYKLISGEKIKVVRMNRPLKISGEVEYLIDDSIIHQSYFNNLAPKVVSYGAGLIQLFHEEVKKEQKIKPISWLGDKVDAVKYVANAVKNKVVSAANVVKSKVVSIAQATKNKVTSTAKAVSNSVKSLAKTTENKIVGAWSGVKSVFYEKENTDSSPSKNSVVKEEKEEKEEDAIIKLASAAEKSEPAPIWDAELVEQNKIESIKAGETAELVARYKNVAGNAEDAAKSDLTQDVVVKGIEFNEKQENNETRTQEQENDKKIEKLRNEEIEAQEQEDAEAPPIRGVEGLGGLKGNNVVRKFVLASGDGTPPEKIILTFPSNFFYLTNQNNITLVGQKAKDVAQINITANNKEVILKDFIDENNWQYDVELVEGENKIIFVAQDISKNLSEPVALNVVLDTAAPSVPMIATNNSNDFTTGWPAVLLTGTKVDDGYFVFADDNKAEIFDENNWQIELNLQEGENLISIFAKDLAGNSSDVANLKIIRNSNLLILNLTNNPPVITNHTSAEFVFNVGVEVEQFYCSLNLEEETKCASPFLIENLQQGLNQFNLRASNNQIDPIHYQWFVDLTPPTCEVAQLDSEQQTENFNLIINSQDNFEIKNWNVEYQVNGGEWQALASYSANNVIEFIGEDTQSYGFRCQSTDMANNISAAKDMADADTTINLNLQIHEPTILPSQIHENMILTKKASPYIALGMITVEPNAVLTLEQGTIIKFYNNAGIEVMGKLEARGTEKWPVVFTSYNDDTYGGDTNKNDTNPQGGDWAWVFFHSSSESSIIENAIFRYGGYYASIRYWDAVLQVYESQVDVANSIFEYNDSVFLVPAVAYIDGKKSEFRENLLRYNGQGIKVAGGEIIIDGNTIAENTGSGIILLENVKAEIKNNQILNNKLNDPFERSVYAIETDSPYFSLNNNIFQGNGFDEIYIDLEIEETLVLPAAVYKTGVIFIYEKGVLSLLPGTVFKNDPYSAIYIYGELKAYGDDSRKIIFTSAYDDSAESGGDTNNDGENTKPNAGDWTWLEFDSAIGLSELNKVVFKYGGYCAIGKRADAQIVINNGAVKISDGEFSEQKITARAVHVFKGNLEIYDSIIEGNLNQSGLGVGVEIEPGAGNVIISNTNFGNAWNFGIFNKGGNAVEALNNWWSDATGPLHDNNPGGKGVKVSDGVNFYPWSAQMNTD